MKKEKSPKHNFGGFNVQLNSVKLSSGTLNKDAMSIATVTTATERYGGISSIFKIL